MPRSSPRASSRPRSTYLTSSPSTGAQLLDTGVADGEGGTVVGVLAWKSDVMPDARPAFFDGFTRTDGAHDEGARGGPT